MDFKVKLESILDDKEVAESFFYDYFEPSNDYDFDVETRNVFSQYTISVENSFNGKGCGDNSEYWVVYKFQPVNGDVAFYIKFNGWYSTYEGHGYYTDWFYVEPVDVTITVTQYFPVK